MYRIHQCTSFVITTFCFSEREETVTLIDFGICFLQEIQKYHFVASNLFEFDLFFV